MRDRKPTPEALVAAAAAAGARFWLDQMWRMEEANLDSAARWALLKQALRQAADRATHTH